VFDDWLDTFGDSELEAVDLQDGLQVKDASMADYAEQVAEVVARQQGRVYVCGWSMGGLVTLMAAALAPPWALTVIEPSPPAEVQGTHPEVRPRSGTFDPEEVYGRFAGVRTRRESLLARLERKKGISVPKVPCPLLVVHGAQFPEERGRAVVTQYEADELSFPELNHGQLVSRPEVREAIHGWFSAV
jgi:pimeloyl-ACP methyl ester carboxylesterase